MPTTTMTAMMMNAPRKIPTASITSHTASLPTSTTLCAILPMLTSYQTTVNRATAR